MNDVHTYQIDSLSELDELIASQTNNTRKRLAVSIPMQAGKSTVMRQIAEELAITGRRFVVIGHASTDDNLNLTGLKSAVELMVDIEQWSADMRIHDEIHHDPCQYYDGVREERRPHPLPFIPLGRAELPSVKHHYTNHFDSRTGKRK